MLCNPKKKNEVIGKRILNKKHLGSWICRDDEKRESNCYMFVECVVTDDVVLVKQDGSTLNEEVLSEHEGVESKKEKKIPTKDCFP